MASSCTICESDLEVLSQEIDDETGSYRIRGGQMVYYLTIATDIFDEDKMCRPHLVVPKLSDFPNGEWTRMEVYCEADGSLRSRISREPLPAVRTT